MFLIRFILNCTTLSTVIPLNETNGIIEWVHNLTPFRMILNKLYKGLTGFKPLKAEETKNFITVANDFEGKFEKFLLPNFETAIFHPPPPFIVFAKKNEVVHGVWDCLKVR